MDESCPDLALEKPCAHGDCKTGQVHPAVTKRERSHIPKMSNLHQCPRDCPGFADPLAVTQVCLPILMAVTHRSLRSKSANECDHSKYCEGIRIYLLKWTENENVGLAVQKYIKFPCTMEMRASIKGSHTRALQFLTSYLRARGPLIQWEIRPGNEDVMRRCLNTLLTANLKQLSDLEFSTVVMIGRYLQYLTNVAYSHQLHFFRMILAKVWGPLLIRPFYSPLYNTDFTVPSERQRVELSIAIFFKVLDSANWYIYEPYEGIHMPDCSDVRNEQHLIATDGSENASEDIPQSLKETMSDYMKEESIRHATESVTTRCPVHHSKCFVNESPRGASGQLQKNQCPSFSPDGCQL